MSVNAAPAPIMRPEAPDVRSDVQSTESDYKPGVFKQSEDVQPEADTDKSTDDEEYEYVDDDEDTTQDSNSSEKNTVNTNSTQSEEYNPINSDATENNIKNNNYNPPKTTTDNTEADKVSTDKKTVKKDKKKDKSEKKKNPYKGYNDAENDPYLNSLDDTSATTTDTPQAQKTYTQADYEQAYRDMPVPTFTFLHGVDPDQYYDMKDTMWSPYPLLRLNSPLYFKTITVEPGYYLLTPREYKGNWYILFKEAGVVKYTIPVFSRDYTPEFYYRDTLPELEMNHSQRWQIKFLNAWGKYIRKSKRRPAVSTNVELTDLDNNFLLIELYYGPHKYSTIFRIEKF